MITEDILITSKDLMKWLNREITEDDEELCMYLSNAVKNQYEYHKEIKRLKNDLINLLRIIDKNCDDLEGTEEEFDSLDRTESLLKELKEGK